MQQTPTNNINEKFNSPYILLENLGLYWQIISSNYLMYWKPLQSGSK